MMNCFKSGLLALALPFSLFAQSQTLQKVKVTGKFVNLEENYNKIYVFYTDDGNKRLDSASVIRGKYSFELEISEPVLISMLGLHSVPGQRAGVMMSDKNKIQVYVEPGKISITNKNNYTNFSVKGSVSHSDYEKLNKMAAERQGRIAELSGELFNKSTSPERKKELEGLIAREREEISEKVYKKYIDENPASPILFYALQRYSGSSREGLQKTLDLYQQLPASQRDSKSGIAFAKRIQGQLDITIGSMAPDFALPTPDGQPVALSSFRGKYVLLDFWASWCGPCRKENPHVVAAFNKFKDKGFTVFGVSLDKASDKQKWIDAIAKDNLGAWTNVSDLKYWNSEPALKYGVTGIPQNYLIDPSGKIIAKNLRGEALEKKLEELL